MPYDAYDDQFAPPEVLAKFHSLVGDYISPFSFHMGWQFKKLFSDKSLLNGQISDQIGKVCKTQAYPEWLADLEFFKSLNHNFSKEAGHEIVKWISEIKHYHEHKFICDLWEWEIRLGRWASQHTMSFSICGVDSLNIYNCRDLILQWVSIPNVMRARKWIHHMILQCNDERLLKYEFNPLRKGAQSAPTSLHYRHLLKKLLGVGVLKYGLYRFYKIKRSQFKRWLEHLSTSTNIPVGQ